MSWKVIIVTGRLLTAMAAVGGATFLAFHDEAGWGWMIFLAIMLGMVSWSDDGENK